jgi:hypothetical protein
VKKEKMEITDLMYIKEALETNPDIEIVGIKEQNYLTEKSYHLTEVFEYRNIPWHHHIVNFFVIPKKELYEKLLLYSDEELSLFLLNLVPIEPKEFQISWPKRTKNLRGVLVFEEIIGKEKTEKRIITLDDKDLFNLEGFQNGERKEDKPKTALLKRKIQVNLYPSESAAKGGFTGTISFSDQNNSKKLLRRPGPIIRKILKMLK